MTALTPPWVPCVQVTHPDGHPAVHAFAQQLGLRKPVLTLTRHLNGNWHMSLASSVQLPLSVFTACLALCWQTAKGIDQRSGTPRSALDVARDALYGVYSELRQEPGQAPHEALVYVHAPGAGPELALLLRKVGWDTWQANAPAQSRHPAPASRLIPELLEACRRAAIAPDLAPSF